MSTVGQTPTAAEAELFTNILLDEAEQIYNELNLTPCQLADRAANAREQISLCILTANEQEIKFKAEIDALTSQRNELQEKISSKEDYAFELNKKYTKLVGKNRELLEVIKEAAVAHVFGESPNGYTAISTESYEKLCVIAKAQQEGGRS